MAVDVDVDVDVVEAVRRCGGRASWSQLRSLRLGRSAVRAAREAGTIVRSRRGHYRLASLDQHLAVAHELAAVLSHRSAALHHGLAVATAPEVAEVIVPRNRNLSAAQQRRATVRWRALRDADHTDGVTTVLRTVIDCARDLPFPEALAVADSALRGEWLTRGKLLAAAREARGPRSARVRRVAEHADMRAANAFESALRALALEAGLQVEPQVQVTATGIFAIVDLADVRRRLVIEAESFEYHGSRKGFRKDVRRYTEFAVIGWTVLRFTWEDVMFQPHYVRWALRSWRLCQDGKTVDGPPAHLPRLA